MCTPTHACTTIHITNTTFFPAIQSPTTTPPKEGKNNAQNHNTIPIDNNAAAMDFSTLYPTLAEAQAAATACAHAAGFDLTVHKRYPRAGAETRVTLRCSRGGREDHRHNSDDTHESKRRKTASKLTGCAYKANLRRQTGAPGAPWRVEPLGGGGTPAVHNHELAESPEAFSSYRSANLALYKERIIAMWRAGTRPGQIISNIREEGGEVHFGLQDIQNLLSVCRREELAGRTPIEWLYEVSFPFNQSIARLA